MMEDSSSVAVQTEQLKFGDHQDLRGRLYKLFMDIPRKCRRFAMAAMDQLFHALLTEVYVYGHRNRYYLSHKIADCIPNLVPVKMKDYLFKLF